MHGVCANHDLIGMTSIMFKLLGIQIHTNQHCMSLVKINDFHALFGEGDCGVGKNVF